VQQSPWYSDGSGLSTYGANREQRPLTGDGGVDWQLNVASLSVGNQFQRMSLATASAPLDPRPDAVSGQWAGQYWTNESYVPMLNAGAAQRTGQSSQQPAHDTTIIRNKGQSSQLFPGALLTYLKFSNGAMKASSNLARHVQLFWRATMVT
jgi:hypothetical protein